MTSNAPGTCCYKGVKHDGEAVGRYETYGDLEVYISEASSSSRKGIILLTDVLGHRFINAQLLADQFAANEYLVMMPDLFHGDPVPLNAEKDFDLNAWFGGAYNNKGIKHLPPSVDPIVETCVSKLREQYNIKRLGAVGYCFGAKYVVRFLHDTNINVGYVAHPSLVEKTELEKIEGPLAIAAAEDDFMFPTEKRLESEKILGKLDIPWQINLYSGTEHGFAVRCDLSVPRQKLARESAFLQAVQWFDVHL